MGHRFNLRIAIFLCVGILMSSGCGDGDLTPTPRPDAESDVGVDGTSSDASIDSGNDVAMVDSGPVDGSSLDVGTDAEPPDDCPRVRIRVSAGNSLNVRETPNTDAEIVDTLPNGTVIGVMGRVVGEVISGNSEWFRVESRRVGFVSGAFASCTTDAIPILTPPDAFYLPLVCGMSARISQGNNGTTSHSGRSRFAFDFAIPLDTPMVAMADAVVDETFDETGPGERCYDGGGPDCFRFANYVALRHADGTGSIYKHLNRVDVSVGQLVPAGTVIGLSGSTGYSTGPHAHVMRQELCGTPLSCQSVALVFGDVPETGVPVQGDTVTSGNCP